MSHTTENYGIVTERYNNSVAIFGTDTYQLIHRISLPNNITEPIDVVITPDESKAVVVTGYSMYTLQLNLLTEPPVFTEYAKATDYLLDVDISPDGRFAAIVDGLGPDRKIFSYKLENNSYVNQLPAAVHGVAISPAGSGLILTGEGTASNPTPTNLKIFYMDPATGLLTDPNITVNSHGIRPDNINFTRDGKFAFVVNSGANTPEGRNLAVFNTENKNNITFLASASIDFDPQSAAVSRDGRKVYVLTSNTVDIFNFDPLLAPFLTKVGSFDHGLSIADYLSIEQIALDRTETKLFISSAGNVVRAFNAQTGQFISDVQGVVPNGGIATSKQPHPQPPPSRGLIFS